MTRAVMEQSWDVQWDGRLVTTAIAEPAAVGCLRVDGEWLAIARIVAVEGYIDGPESGVRVHLDDGTTSTIFADEGTVDYTATWNEYLCDGAWAFDAGRQLARWLGVRYTDDSA